MNKVFSMHRAKAAIVALVVSVLSVGLHAEDGSESITTIKRYLLTSPSSADTRLVVRTLDMLAPAEQDLRDIVAERLYQAADSGFSEQDEDAVAWYAKALGELGDARYLEVIDYSAKTIESKKIVRELISAKRGLVDRGNGSYAKGTVDLAAVRAQAQAEIAAGRRAGDVKMDGLLKGRSLPELIAQLGMPDHIGSQEFHLSGVLIVKARTDAVMAHYYGHGIVVFSWDIKQKVWIADKVWLDSATQAQPYAGPHPLFASILASADGKYFRVALVRARQVAMTDEALVALLRKRLLASLAETEPHEVAALEYVCTLLAMRADPENRAVLEKVMNEAVSEDLRDRAEDRLEQMLGKNVNSRKKKCWQTRKTRLR
ncbi:MAG: hypothetical protein ACOY3E_16090 [Pseudomonadota bacterium]